MGTVGKLLDHLLLRSLLRRRVALAGLRQVDREPWDDDGADGRWRPLRQRRLANSRDCSILVADLPAGLPAGPVLLNFRSGVMGIAVRISHEEAEGSIVSGWTVTPAEEVLLMFAHPRFREIRVLVQKGAPHPDLEMVQIGWPEAFLRMILGSEGLPDRLSDLLRLLVSPLNCFRRARIATNLPMTMLRFKRRLSSAREDREMRFLYRAGIVNTARDEHLPLSGALVLLLPHASGWSGWQESLASLSGSRVRVLVAGWAGAPPAGLSGAGALVVGSPSAANGAWWGDGDPALTWVVPLRAGDRLAHAWHESLSGTLAGRPAADLIYGDENSTISGGQHGQARFKPDWSPETLLGGNYLGRALAVRGDLWIRAGGWDGDGGDAAFYSCAMRCASNAVQIGHLPLILLHCGHGSGGSPAAVQEMVELGCRKRGIDAVVVPVSEIPDRFLVKPRVHGRPLVSVIIPTRDGADILRVCLDTLFTRTAYQEFEVLVVDNGSVQEATRRLFAEAEGRWKGRFRVLPLDIPFNYSRLNNVGAEAASGEHLLLLNNDIEIIEPGWLEAMLGWAQQPGIGFVGAKLLYPDRSVQHIGVTVGIGGGADHLHKGASRHEAGYQGCLQTVCNWTAATAACLLVPRPVWRQVGGLDESFAVAFNDVDFCLRVGAAGYRGVVTPAAELIHHESKSRGLDDTPVKRARFLGELARLRERWGTDRLVDPMLGELISRASTDPDVHRPCLSAAT